MSDLLPAWAAGHVYLLETDTAWQKVGFSKDPSSRASHFQSLPFRVWLAHSFPVGHQNIEWLIHRALSPYHVRGEWFSLPDSLLVRFKQIVAVPTPDDLPEEFASPELLAIWKASQVRRQERQEKREQQRLNAENRRYLRALRNWKSGVIWKRRTGWCGRLLGAGLTPLGVESHADRAEAVRRLAERLFGPAGPPSDDDLVAILATADSAN